MLAKALKEAFALVPDDAEVFVTADDMGEFPVEHFQFFPEDKTVWLVLEDLDDPDEEEFTDEPVEEETTELSSRRDDGFHTEAEEALPAGVTIIDAEYSVIEHDACRCTDPATARCPIHG